jgi:hypothetical protein
MRGKPVLKKIMQATAALALATGTITGAAATALT